MIFLKSLQVNQQNNGLHVVEKPLETKTVQQELIAFLRNISLCTCFVSVAYSQQFLPKQALAKFKAMIHWKKMLKLPETIYNILMKQSRRLS